MLLTILPSDADAAIFGTCWPHCEHAPVKEFAGACLAFKRNLEVARKGPSAARSSAADAAASAPLIPTVGRLQTIQQSLGTTTSESVYEAKVGIKAALAQVDDEAVGSAGWPKLLKQPYWKRSQKVLQKALRGSIVASLSVMMLSRRNPRGVCGRL